MATGGSPSKGSSSDSHTRSGWQSTSDDAVSMNSILNELRPNNLEVSEWKDSTLDSSKRRKKGNRERERERGQSLLHDVHHSERHKHAPSTYPRTKLPSNSQLGEKMELENLRRHISFDGFDELSSDDEKNNDRYMSSSSNRREILAPTNHSRRRQDTSCTNYQSRQCLPTNSCRQKEQKRNQNNENDTCEESGMENDDDDEEEEDDEDDRDKQMHVEQSSRNDKVKDRTQEAITDSNQIVARLMQIKDYLKQVKLMMDTLEQSDDPSDHRKVSKLAQVMSSLQEQEKSYMEILQKLWIIRKHALLSSKSYQDEISKPESPECSDSLDFEEKSQTSDVSIPNFDPGMDERGDNTVSMQHHQLLLKQIIEQKEQLKLLQQRQEALLTIEKDAVRKLAEAREKQIFLEQQSKESMSSPTFEAAEFCPVNQLTENGLPEDFLDSAKSRKNNLPPSNQYSEEKSPINDVTANEEFKSDRFHQTISQGRVSLQNKLQHLQEKRKYVDELLNYVKTLHVQHREQLEPMNNDSERLDPSAYALQSTEFVEENLDSQNQREMNLEESSKYEEIQGMREHLKHLQSLFQQCQNNAGPDIPESETHSTDKDALKMSHNIKHVKVTSIGSYSRFPESNNIQNNSDNEDEDLAVELGSLMHQPEVRDKFNELREAKERLRHLQELIGKLNESSEPSASIDKVDEFVDAVSQTDGPEPLGWQPDSPSRDAEVAMGVALDPEEASEDQLLPLQNKSAEIKLKMQEQLTEVKRLKDQRRKLLSFHQQLLKFHDSLPDWNDRTEKSERDKTSEVTFAPEPLVQEMGQIAYSSNDELYNKMRKERIQREELRQKKKEMEDLMHKDKPKRHYSRNQDNQSDSVSYSTDFLGANASADITMATWGGSTADNLESINEDCDRQGDDRRENEEDDDEDEAENNDYNDDDDGYPSDDIIQMEEEECGESSSKETYTIEKDAQNHRAPRDYQSPPLRGLTQPRNTVKTRNKCKYFGLQNESRMEPRHNSYTRETLSERFSHKQPKQENIRAAEYIIQEDECDGSLNSANSPLSSLERQMDRMAMTYQELLSEQQLLRQQLYLMRYQNGNSSTFETSPNSNLYWQPNLVMSPLESQNPASQQQMLLALNQCFQHLSIQQSEMNNLQRQIHNLNLNLQSSKSVPSFNTSNQSVTPSANQWSTKSNQFSWDPNFQSSAHCTDTLTGSRLNPPRAKKPKKQGSNILASSSGKSKKSRNHPGVEFRLGKQNPKKCSKDCNQTCSYFWNFTGAEKCQGKGNSIIQYMRPPASAWQKCTDIAPGYRLVENSKNKPKTFSEINPEIPKSRGGNPSSHANPQLSCKSSDQKVKNVSDVWLNKETISNSCQFLSESAKQEDNHNFDSLKSDIYAEVAKLISQNEKHPKYLICLFQKLQCLTSDYMRQHTLQALLDIIIDEDNKEDCAMYSENPKPVVHAKTRFDPTKSVQTKSERSSRAKKISSFNEQEFDYEDLANVPLISKNDYLANGSPKKTVINSKKVLTPLHGPPKSECKDISNGIECLNSCSSAMDQGNESCLTDRTNSKADKSPVSYQIKTITNQLLPFIKVNKDQAFSAKLLTEMKQRIFFLLSQPDVKFKIDCSKLNHMLESALSEFESQSVRTSYQNVLAKVSEIIYNEVAYVRLIEDLGDDSISKATLSKFGLIETADNNHLMDEDFGITMPVTNAHGADEGLSMRNPSLDNYKLINGIQCENKIDYDNLKNPTILNGVSSSSERDEAHLQSSAMKIELAVSETKPFSRIGSDEDDEDEEESHMAEDPSVTAVSLAVENECCSSAEKGDGDIHPQNKHPLSSDNEAVPSGKLQVSPLNFSVVNTPSSPTVFDAQQAPENNKAEEPASQELNVEDLPNRLHALNNSELNEPLNEQCTPIAAFFDNFVNGTEVAGDGEAVPANKIENSTNLDPTKDNIDQ